METVAKDDGVKGRRVDLVVARYGEGLEWLACVPAHVRVIVYNKGWEVTEREVLERIDVLIRLENVGRESETFLTHVGSGLSRDADRVVFTQGDPFPHSPDFLDLLEREEEWREVQALSVRWLEQHDVPPRLLVDGDRRDRVGGLRVRREVFSLRTLAPPGFHDAGAVGISRDYRRCHGLPAGTNIVEHFLRLAGWDELADEAGAADLGVFSYGAVFAVAGGRLARVPGVVLEGLRVLSCGDRSHGYLCERLWLHLFGAAFVAVDMEEKGGSGVR
ncbi:hypothetical protein JIN84_05845 [Luteolibacter yonseiensis]|uniref:Uncharacterized protein n=1 Tax=Luteolibacter yonseiensis TaxID=1144680 RepID=A0A934VB79_9BACT|nr:hypothetical protein [Luteolibacter yonseiensis]MBK1815124.1 hypothetical protein [Luteolibacter yonseiensis]